MSVCVYANSQKVAHKMLDWLRFVWKLLDCAVIIGELFAGPMAKCSNESKQVVSL